MRVLVILIVILTLSTGTFHELCSSFVPMKTNITTLPQSFSTHRSDIWPMQVLFVPRETEAGI
jgi:hypothetical protein